MKTTTVLAAALAATAFVLCAGGARASVDDRSAQVIRASGAAMHISVLRNFRAMRIDGDVRAVGLSGKQTQWADLTAVRFAEYSTLPPFQQDDGYDGRVAWNRDQSGLVWDEGGDAGVSTSICSAYMSSFALWKPDAAGATVSYAGVQHANGREYDALRVQPVGAKVPMELWFDRTTHVLSRESQAVGPLVNTVSLLQYRTVHGLSFPRIVHIDNTNGNNVDFTVTAVAFDPPGAAAHLARPRSTVHDFSMRNGQMTTTVPVALVENHVYLDVMLNGKGPYHMIFDTGGANIIDPAVAQEIGALGKGNMQGSGVGAKTESFSFAKVDSLTVGDAVVRDQQFIVAPVRAGFGISGGRPADGLIGWEVLARYVTTFDYAGNQVILTMPPAPTPPPDAHAVHIVFNGTQPQIPCAIDNIPSQCTIDTGARDTMTFYTPFLTEHPNVKPQTLTQNGVNGFGVGGASFSQLGRLTSLTIGNFTLNDLIAGYSNATKGAFANPFVATNLGGNLLRRFTVTFDYAEQRMTLAPNAAFAERDTYERSGLFIVNAGGKMTVVDSRPGTPAADAGIAKGEVITSLDGASASTLSLDAVRAYFRKPAGTTVKLVVVGKDGKERNVSLTLRDYV
ncbi:MAG: aspartyl protease family protein [Candidatus Eremiobacteraeota bacterium]|nr:aspartyl protease family protein [Candidatus Eremiobacteraeota bacterium]